MQNMVDVQALKSRIQVLETLLSHKDLELKNTQSTLTQILALMDSAPVSQTKEISNVETRLIPDSHLVMRGENTVSLTAREYIILNHLFFNKDKACTREELLENFNDSPDMTARNIDVHVFSLRKKLQKVGLGVETVWGIGYKMME